MVLRAENINANYVNGKSMTIIPMLSKLLIEKGLNIVYLPRYDIDKSYVIQDEHVFIPSKPLNGLDLCYYSSGVFTGAGTLAREAACLGIPSFSFFLGERLLAVDQKLVREEKITFSRDPAILVNSFLKSNKKLPDIKRSISVSEEVKSKLNDVINKLY